MPVGPHVRQIRCDIPTNLDHAVPKIGLNNNVEFLQ